MQIALAVPGALQPDVLTVVVDQSDSVQTAISRPRCPAGALEALQLGLAVIDVLDVKGVVIVDTGQVSQARRPGSRQGRSSRRRRHFGHARGRSRRAAGLAPGG
jgi:hypothetical protein